MRAISEQRATRRLAATTLAILTLASIAPSVALAAPTLTVTPGLAAPGSAMVATGSGFAEGEPVTMYLDGEEFDRLTVSVGGTFVAAFTLPLTIASGRHTVTAVAPSGEASDSFTVAMGNTTTTNPPTTTTTTDPPTTTSPPTTAPSTTSTTEPPPTAPPTTTPATSPPPAPPIPDPPVSTTLQSVTTQPTTTTKPDGPRVPPPTGEEESPDPTLPSTAAEGPATSVAPMSVESSLTQISVPVDPSGGFVPLRPSVAAGEAPPRIAGASMALGTFSVSPPRGSTGARITMNLVFDGVIPGLTVVELRLAGQLLGEEVGIDSDEVSVQRMVPALEPGTYLLTVESGDLVLAATDFEVTEALMTGPSTRLWLVPLLILMTLLTWSLVGALRHTGENHSIGRPALGSWLRRTIVLRK